MDIQSFVDSFYDSSCTGFGCLFVDDRPEYYGIDFHSNSISTSKKKKIKKIPLSSAYNFFSYLHQSIDHCSDDDEKEILIEKPLYFINVISDCIPQDVKYKGSKESEEKNFNYFIKKYYKISSTEYFNDNEKNNIYNNFSHLLYVLDATGKQKSISRKEEEKFKSNDIDLANWMCIFSPYKNHKFQCKYIFNCNTDLRNSYFFVGLNNFLYEIVETNNYFEYLRNLIFQFLEEKKYVESLKNDEIMLEIKNIPESYTHLISNVYYWNEYFMFYKIHLDVYQSIMNKNNPLMRLAKMIFLHRKIVRNIYFITLFANYVKHFMNYFKDDTCVYRVNSRGNIEEISIENLYNHYYNLYQYFLNLDLIDYQMLFYPENKYIL